MSKHITALFTFKQTLLMWYEAVMQVDNMRCELAYIQLCRYVWLQVVKYKYAHRVLGIHTRYSIPQQKPDFHQQLILCPSSEYFWLNSVWGHKMAQSENRIYHQNSTIYSTAPIMNRKTPLVTFKTETAVVNFSEKEKLSLCNFSNLKH